MTPTSQEMSHIAAIQGLRGLAIGGVLLFHVAPDYWTGGFLGVDMFFLISGFLMCSIMSKPSASVEQFYFRRIRRIVPSYLFLIGLVLFGAAGGFVSAIDYGSLLQEVRKPLKFIANIPNPHENNYFRQGFGVYYFFRHLWSLSTELQFYALVPLLCFGLSKIGLCFRVITCAIIGAASFCSQILDDGDSAHMALRNRIWQFMCGFIAFYAQQLIANEYIPDVDAEAEVQSYPLLNDDACSQAQPTIPTFTVNAPKEQQCCKNQLIATALHNLVQITLIFLLIHYFNSLPFVRISILFFTGLIIISPPSQWTILNSAPLVWLGNISYSVYLVHWPPIQWYFYEMGTISMTPSDGCFVIAFAIAVGYLMEKLFVYLSKEATSWYRLFGILALCYLFIAAPFAYLHQNHVILDKNNLRTVIREEAKEKLFYDIDRVWKGEDPNMTPLELAAFNFQLSAVIHLTAPCPNKNTSAIPTKFDIEREISFGDLDPITAIHGITTHCYETGRGTKNIVIVGNSDAQMLYFGVKKQFEGVYANLTMLSAAGCPLIDWGGKEHHQRCVDFRNKIHDVLKQWDHPIDILIVGHSYQFPYGLSNVTMDSVTPEQLPSDKYYMRLKHVFDGFEEVARDFMFIPSNAFFPFIQFPVDLIARRILQNKHVNMFRSLRIEQNKRAPIDDRVKYINCHKCIHVNWEDVWCSRDFHSCDSVDHERKIGYFSDDHHVNAMGSLLYGRHLRQLYDKHVNI